MSATVTCEDCGNKWSLVNGPAKGCEVCGAGRTRLSFRLVIHGPPQEPTE